MTLYDLLNTFAGYNSWANQQIMAWLKGYPEERVSVETPSSFSTIPKTLQHILNAQRLYTSMLEETEVTFLQTASYHNIMEELSSSSRRLALIVDSMGHAGIQETRHVERGAIKRDAPVSEIILTCLNHSTYHRGQIITMGRALGLESPPVTDFYRYSLASTV